MKVLIFKNKTLAAKRVANEIAKKIKAKPNLVLFLPTGSTSIPLYMELVRLHKKGKIDFSKVISFNLDEYAGLKSENKNSYHYFMEKHFFKKVNIKKENTHFPKNKNYEKEIKKSGGIDIAVLGIGENAHIAFNEPGSSEKSSTRKVKLSLDTRKVNSRFFPSVNLVPKYAFSVGIKTILSSRKIILLAFGKKKSDAIKKTLKGKINSQVPASFLRKNKNTFFFLDKSAASKLK